MKNKLIFPVILALISILGSCDKVEERVYLEEVIPPELITTPLLDLKRENAADTLIFVGTPVDPGFSASIKYSLQVRPAGDESAKPSSIISSFQDSLMKASVEELNGYLKPKAKPWIPTALDFIIKAEMISSAGRGAEEHIFYSTPVPIVVTTYGDPRLDLIGSGEDQILELEDGVYTGLVDLLKDSPFTFLNPETGIAYGGADGTLVVNGAAIVPPVDGEYRLTVNIDDMTYELTRASEAIMYLVDSGIEQSINPGSEAGVYQGIVVLAAASPFTMFDDETGLSYGGSGGTLEQDGAAITPAGDGTYLLTVNTTGLSYELMAYSVGVVGAFNEWSAPDVPMTWDGEDGVWKVTMDLPTGPMKFRVNEDWTDRWGPGTNTDLPEVGGSMELPNGDADINITTAGNYSIELTITGYTEATSLSAVASFTLN